MRLALVTMLALAVGCASVASSRFAGEYEGIWSARVEDVATTGVVEMGPSRRHSVCWRRTGTS
jgi:hypothetical protein